MSTLIKRGSYYLAEGSASRGSQAGISRVWTEEPHRALQFASASDAQAFATKNFDDYELSALAFVPKGA